MRGFGFQVLTTIDKEKRDQMFIEFRMSTEANERQVVKFSGTQELPGRPEGFEPRYKSTYSVAYPNKVPKQKHGSKRSPRVFPGRKKD